MLIMGNRDDIDQLPAASSTILTTVLNLIGKYDLLGEVAYPKHHKQLEVGDIYIGLLQKPRFIKLPIKL